MSTVLTRDEEDVIYDYTIKMSDMGFGERISCEELTEKSGRMHPF